MDLYLPVESEIHVKVGEGVKGGSSVIGGVAMRGSFLKENKKRRALYLIPNLLTTGNLFSGLASIVFVF